jgi:hypothetical protein
MNDNDSEDLQLSIGQPKDTGNFRASQRALAKDINEKKNDTAKDILNLKTAGEDAEAKEKLILFADDEKNDSSNNDSGK